MGLAPSLCSEFLLSATSLPVIDFLVFRKTVCVLLNQMCSFSYRMLYKMEVQGQNVAWKRKIVTSVVNFLIFPWKYCDILIKFRLLHSSIENRSVSPATRWSVSSFPPIIMSAVTPSLQTGIQNTAVCQMHGIQFERTRKQFLVFSTYGGKRHPEPRGPPHFDLVCVRSAHIL